MYALVLGVGLALGIIDAGQEQCHVRVGLRQGGDQRERTAAAGLYRSAAPGIGARSPERLEDRPGSVNGVRLALVISGYRYLRAPRCMTVKVLIQCEECPLGIITRRKADADAGSGPRHEFVSSIRHRRSINSQDGNGRSCPDTAGKRAFAKKLNAGPEAGETAQLGLVYVHSGWRARVQALDHDITRRVVQGGDEPA